MLQSLYSVPILDPFYLLDSFLFVGRLSSAFLPVLLTFRIHRLRGPLYVLLFRRGMLVPLWFENGGSMLLSAHVPLSIAAKFCVRFFFIFSLSSTFGKYSFVMFPLVVCVQFLCHFFTEGCLSVCQATYFIFELKRCKLNHWYTLL